MIRAFNCNAGKLVFPRFTEEALASGRLRRMYVGIHIDRGHVIVRGYIECLIVAVPVSGDGHPER